MPQSLPPAPAGRGRVNDFDLTRFVLASAVILAHCYPVLYGPDDREPLTRASHGQGTLRAAAVDGLFAMSGSRITGSWLSSRSAASYFRKRVARIYPASTTRRRGRSGSSSTATCSSPCSA